jgi:hypothetical protein
MLIRAHDGVVLLASGTLNDPFSKAKKDYFIKEKKRITETTRMLI